MRNIVIVAHNLRSSHNVGSLLRTAEGLGAVKVYLTGYTPYPIAKHDGRLPHIAAKVHKDIQKTALGAEQHLGWSYRSDVHAVIAALKNQGYSVCALEQTPDSVLLPAWDAPNNVALLVGREVEGVEHEVLAACDMAVQIPMFGKKESFNVVQAASMALYHCRFMS